MGSVNDDITTLLNIYYFRSDRISFLGGFSQIVNLAFWLYNYRWLYA